MTKLQSATRESADSVAGLARKAKRRFRRWHRLYDALHPTVTIPSTVRLIIARELADRGRITPATTVGARLQRPSSRRIKVRPGGSDLFTLEEVLQREVYAAVPELLPSCERIIDLGAHIGLSSLYFLSRYPRAKLLAIEPHAGSFNLLRQNLQPWIDSGQCIPLHAAVWSEDGFVAPAVSVDAWYQASFRIQPRGESEAGSIRGLSMGTLIRMSGANEIHLVKIDIEGSEAELFGSNIEWLQEVRCLAIEFHGDSRQRISFDELMRRHGFDVVSDTGHTVIALMAKAH
jgi:FkbM family methyltransferase